MKSKKKSKRLPIVLALGIVAVLMIVGLVRLKSYRIGPGVDVPRDVPVRTTLHGTYVCLPHKNAGEVTTMECAYGLKITDGLFYALDTSVLQPQMPDIPTGTKIAVEGVLVPIEQISSNHWKIYDIAGIMQVTTVMKE